MSYANRTSGNNQFKVDHAWPGVCSLCFDEVAVFDGSNSLGKPKVLHFKGNRKKVDFFLNDNSIISINLCDDCATNLKSDDFDKITNGEFKGWQHEVSLLDWPQDKKDSFLNRYSQLKIIGVK